MPGVWLCAEKILGTSTPPCSAYCTVRHFYFSRRANSDARCRCTRSVWQSASKFLATTILAQANLRKKMTCAPKKSKKNHDSKHFLEENPACRSRVYSFEKVPVENPTCRSRVYSFEKVPVDRLKKPRAVLGDHNP